MHWSHKPLSTSCPHHRQFHFLQRIGHFILSFATARWCGWCVCGGGGDAYPYWSSQTSCVSREQWKVRHPQPLPFILAIYPTLTLSFSVSSRFAPFLHQIVHVIVDDMPHVYPNIDYQQHEQWHNDFHQFNCVTRGWDLLQLHPSDLVIISNVDEIPHPRVLRSLRGMNNTTNVLRGLDMAMYYYNLNTKVSVHSSKSYPSITIPPLPTGLLAPT